MHKLGRTLVVDDSRLMRELLRLLLAPHAAAVDTAGSCAGACQAVDADPGLDLVVCDVVLPDGSGLEVLEHVASRAEPRPEVVLITARWQEEHVEAAAALGARGYLTKPISLRDIRSCLELSPDRPPIARELRRRTLARASVTDPEAGAESLLCFDVHDLSSSGALLETKGPLPLGMQLELEFLLGERSVRTRATVVRVQEPSWLQIGGAAIRFDWIDDPATVVEFVGSGIERLLADHGCYADE